VEIRQVWNIKKFKINFELKKYISEISIVKHRRQAVTNLRIAHIDYWLKVKPVDI
jgi:hypothetical protein